MRRVARLAALLSLLLAAAPAEARSWSWLGVRIRDLTPQEMDEITVRHGIREGFGVYIVEIIEGTPAARAGMKRGDVVVAFGNRPVTETRLLQRLVAAAPTDVITRLTVLRAEGRQQVEVRLATMPSDLVGDRVAAEFGFVIRDVEAQGEAPAARPGGDAPVVSVVLRGSAAERADLKVSDVLLQIGEQAVVTREAARRALASASLEQPLRLTVRRDDRRVDLTLSAPVRR